MSGPLNLSSAYLCNHAESHEVTQGTHGSSEEYSAITLSEKDGKHVNNGSNQSFLCYKLRDKNRNVDSANNLFAYA